MDWQSTDNHIDSGQLRLEPPLPLTKLQCIFPSANHLPQPTHTSLFLVIPQACENLQSSLEWGTHCISSRTDTVSSLTSMFMALSHNRTRGGQSCGWQKDSAGSASGGSSLCWILPLCSLESGFSLATVFSWDRSLCRKKRSGDRDKEVFPGIWSLDLSVVKTAG